MHADGEINVPANYNKRKGTRNKTAARTSLSIITVLAEHFRRHVVWCAAGGVQQLCAGSTVSVRISDVQGAKTKVGDLQVAIRVQQKVLRGEKIKGRCIDKVKSW